MATTTTTTTTIASNMSSTCTEASSVPWRRNPACDDDDDSNKDNDDRMDLSSSPSSSSQERSSRCSVPRTTRPHRDRRLVPQVTNASWLRCSWTLLVLTAVTWALVSVHWKEEDAPHAFAARSTMTHMRRFLLNPLEEEEEDHAPLFPLTTSDYVGLICATLGLMIAAGGGIGGGGILVPIYILILGFSPKHAIPLSNVTVLGGAVANTILNTPKRHPIADRPLVDWDLILVMEPLTIGGALVGAFLNKLLPEQLLVLLLVALLSFTAYKSLTKALRMYKKETRAMRRRAMPTGNDNGNDDANGTNTIGVIVKESELTRMVSQQDEEEQDEAGDSLLANMELEEGETSPGDAVDAKHARELEEILNEERVTPPMNLMILITMFIVVLCINLMKGGGAFPSPLGIRCGSTSFWVANALMLGWILVISFFARMYLVRRCAIKRTVGYQYVEGDIEWNERATIVYPLVCCLAGFFAGMFGIGGGIVKGPLMLQMGVHPAVSSASSACMILFTSFTATTSFVVFGLLVWDYAFVCITIGILATFVGQIGLGYLMKKSQRNSYIVFSIGGVVLISAVLMTIQSLVAMAERTHHHSGGICGKDE